MAQVKVRIPLIGSQNKRNVTETERFAGGKDQHFMNAHYQVWNNPHTGQRTVYLKAREKYETYSSAGSSGGNAGGTAITVWAGANNAAGNVIATSFNGRLFIDANDKGSISSSGLFIDETTISGAANITIVTSAGAGYYYAYGDPGATNISDLEFPPNQTPARTLTGRFVHMDGFPFIMCKDRTIWNGDLNSLSAWTATSFITAQEVPDIGVGLVRMKDVICAFCTKHTEFFRNAGNPAPGSPLSQVGYINVGALNQHAIVQFQETIAFCGVQSGEYGVFILDGMSPRKISTSEIDEFLNKYATTVRLNVVVSWGKALLALTAGVTYGGMSTADEDMLVFDPDVSLWGMWQSDSGIGPIRQSAVTFTPASISSTVFSCFFVTTNDNDTNGYRNTTDECSAVRIRTSKMDMGTRNRKFWQSAALIGDADSSNSVDLTWLDDDYNTEATARTLTMDSNSAVPIAYRLGSSRRRAWGITNGTPTVGWRVEALEVEFDGGQT